ncbi:hypothetical protein [Sporosarcina sp. FA9]|uniref:hypothetical protein n=1 Tax=Sporosarcina sp. FA9 TaxID=3413030 RepID=UPI003F658D09
MHLGNYLYLFPFDVVDESDFVAHLHRLVEQLEDLVAHRAELVVGLSVLVAHLTDFVANTVITFNLVLFTGECHFYCWLEVIYLFFAAYI